VRRAADIGHVGTGSGPVATSADAATGRAPEPAPSPEARGSWSG